MRRSIGGGRKDGALAPSAYPTRKPRPRLESFGYQGQYAYHVVLLTQARSPRFTDYSLARRCTRHLKRTAELLSFRLLAFCFMPDHLHILVLGRDDMANLVRLVQRFKQVTAFEFKRGTGPRLWQQSFYDRTLRVEEDLVEVATYILGNPVRAGLVSSWVDYPLCGGEYAQADGAEAPSLLPRGASRPLGGLHV
jgi:putative transposase